MAGIRHLLMIDSMADQQSQRWRGRKYEPYLLGSANQYGLRRVDVIPPRREWSLVRRQL